jgi:hypothetical protein
VPWFSKTGKMDYSTFNAKCEGLEKRPHRSGSRSKRGAELSPPISTTNGRSSAPRRKAVTTAIVSLARSATTSCAKRSRPSHSFASFIQRI